MMWLLDLADLDLKLIYVPGKELNNPDVLSRCPNLIPKVDDDNENVTLLLPSLFINLIGIALTDKIKLLQQRPPSPSSIAGLRRRSLYPIQIQAL